MELNKNRGILIGEGWVWHSRPEYQKQEFGLIGRLFKILKLSNTFRYPIFNFLIPIQVSGNSTELKNTFFSIKSKNYLNSKDGSIKENIVHFLQEKFQYSCDQIWLQTLPSVFGYVFNPVNFWYCYKNEKLSAVLCEVNNTFGERHFYFIKNLEADSVGKKNAQKRFHVSPFMDISGYYNFEFNLSEIGSQVRIRLFDSNGNLKLDTIIKLSFKELARVPNLYILRKYGWITLMVIWRIHFQALKIWLKGAKFYKRPALPMENVTYDTKSI